MAQTLGVATFTYVPFAFFNLISPLVGAIYGFANLTIERVGPETIEGLDVFQAAGSPAAAKQ